MQTMPEGGEAAAREPQPQPQPQPQPRAYPAPCLKSLTTNDKYETPPVVIDEILRYVPRDALVWEPFVGSGASTAHLQMRGFSTTRGTRRDFFQQRTAPEGAILISNPPYSTKERVFAHLAELGVQRFALLLPLETLGTRFLSNFRARMSTKLQLLVFSGTRLRFLSPTGTDHPRRRVPFTCAWFCWGLDLPSTLEFAEVRT